MPITVDWANTDQTILRFTISGDFTGEDVIGGISGYADLADQVDHEFYMLLDFTAATGSAIKALSRLPEVARALPTRRAAVILAVGSSQTIEMVTGIFSKVYGGKFYYFTSMDDLHAHLRDRLGVQLD